MSARWFHHAPVSKAAFYLVAAATVMGFRYVEPGKLPTLLGLDMGKLLTSGSFWRVLTFHLPFASSSEMIVGMYMLYEFRKLERMIGTRKFGAFVCGVLGVASTILSGLSLTFGIRPATGPYILLFALLMMHQGP